MSLQLQNLDFYKDLKSLRLFDVWLDTPANNDPLDASSIQVCMVSVVDEALLEKYRFGM
jgi:hypothetical protein